MRNVLSSVLIHKCQFCNYECRLKTEKDLKANDGAVWGALAIVIGHAQLEELFAIIDLPTLSARNFTAHQRRIGKVSKY